MGTNFFLKNAAVLALFLTLLAGCRDDHRQAVTAADQRTPVKVEVIIVEEQTTKDQIEIMGTVQASKRAVIASRISGNIIELPVAPGSRVRQGEKLVHINAEEISAQLMQARAQLDQATRNLQREKKLLEQKAATEEAVKSLEDAEKISRANYLEAGTMLGYTSITAPFDGLITHKLADIGDLATPGKALLQIENEDELQVLTDVPETVVLNIGLGMKMEISIPTAGLRLQGVVSEIAPTADSRSRTVPVKLDIEKNENLRSGQFARVTLPGTRVETILVPVAGILPFGQMERVFLAVDGKAQLRIVRTGKHYPEGIEVLSGLNPGDTLIIAGNTMLTDGLPIVVE